MLSHQAVKRLIPKELSVTAKVSKEFFSLSLPDSREVGGGGGAASTLRRMRPDQRGKPEAEAAIGFACCGQTGAMMQLCAVERIAEC